jgi:hypothetical protein
VINLSKTSKVIIGGASAGGIAVLYWSEFISLTLEVPENSLKAFIDSSLFLSIESFKQQNVMTN